ncbi:MAG TPA: choice-of-anchor tandem repeat GloVer-containing protein, partial [Verrucomicrobiae bacterium]|nr:choice-of-anchor tandem repeat GloVer-containing protein [Verrucomicrobiae bacterium]
AQTFMPLHTFALNGTDGGNPAASLMISGSTLYGTASTGVNPGGYSSAGSGTLFTLSTSGGNFTNVYNFTPDVSPSFTNSDGADPQASLILSGETLYGTASIGGTNLAGTVFSVDISGSNFTTLHTFTGGNDGGGPYSGLVLAGGTLFGTTTYGGASGIGALFALSTNGQNFTNIYSFTNANDAAPIGNLILSGNTLYGTTSGGNSGGFGSVFAIGTNGLGYTNLHTFSANSGSPNYTNGDGSGPEAGVILVSNLLYGTASQSGLHGSGVIFAVSTNGKFFTNLYNFTLNSGSPATNGDGANPRGGLVLVSNILYGTTYNGGLSSGTIFAIGTNGLGFTNLHNFTVNDVSPYTNIDGAHPNAGLIFSGNALYGTATGGGNPDSFTGSGTVFSLAVGPALISPPKLSILQAGTNVILTWPTNVTGFNLQSVTNAVSTNWSTVLPGPVVVGGQNTVTNAISGTQKFYRLSD